MKKGSKLLGVLVVTLCGLLFVDGAKAAAYKEYTMGQEIKFNPITGEYCTSGDNCKTFNVINVGKNSRYYEMQLNYNLIPKSTWGDTVNGPTVAVAELKEATKNWKGIEAYYDKVKLPSSSGTYTINYNGSKARMITAEEVAAIYNYQTVGGDKWVWNGAYPSNNIEFNTSNRWLAQNLSTTGYGSVYNDVETENGHFPFDYFTASATGDNKSVYTVQFFNIAMDNLLLNFDYGNYDTGLRPVVRLKKEVDNTVNDSTLVNPIVISGAEVVPGNKIPTIDELSVTGKLKLDNIIWTVKKDGENYQDVTTAGLDTFEEGKTYALILYFDGTEPENYRYYLPINDYVYRYNDVENKYNSHSGDGYTEVVFFFNDIKEKTKEDNVEDKDKQTTTTTVVKKEEKNPKTYDNGMVIIIALIGSILVFGLGSKKLIKKSR